MLQRVLVVEDDVTMADMLRAALEKHFDVTVCTEKAHAVTRAKNALKGGDAPQVVVLDLIINGEGGLDLYRWMRREGIDVPVVFLTGCHAQSPEYREALGTGELVYEKDQFSSRQLVGHLEALVAKKAS